MAPAHEEPGREGSHTDRKSLHGAASCLPPFSWDPHLEDFRATPHPTRRQGASSSACPGRAVVAATCCPPTAAPHTTSVSHGASSQIRVSAGPAGPSPAGLSRDRARRVTDTFSHRVLAHFSALQFRQCTKKPSSSSLYITPWTTKRFIWRKR